MNIIEIHRINIFRGKTQILNELSLFVPVGSIFGYLGENGSGKTTTIQAILGIVGNGKDIYLFGKEMCNNKARISVLEMTGCLIEPYFLYDHLSVKDMFSFIDKLYNKGDKHINYILNLIGLEKDSKKKVKFLSSGMKRRLSIGIALFNEPKLLILDEPINGLDPIGIYQTRELLIELNKKGVTIFISSHILSEIEKTCTDIAIIKQGQIICQNKCVNLLSEYKTASLEDAYIKIIKKTDND